MRFARALTIAAAAAMLVGAFLLRWSATDAATGNWFPVHLPLPPVGINVSDTFTLESAGDFELQIVTTATGAERASRDREGASAEMRTNVTIAGPRGFHTTRDVSKLELSSWTTDTDIYTARDSIRLPYRGEYQIDFQRGAGTELFGNRGAVVRLERIAPSGYGVTYLVFDCVAYIAVAASFASLIFIAVKSNPGTL